MKRFFSLILIFTLILCLCSCGRYVSSYSAVGLIRSQTSHSCEASFYSLKGQLVFKIKSPVSEELCELQCDTEAEEGELIVYYDVDGTKQELTRVKAGEAVDDFEAFVEGGKTVYIIIEAAEKSRGKISVEIDD